MPTDAEITRAVCSNDDCAVLIEHKFTAPDGTVTLLSIDMAVHCPFCGSPLRVATDIDLEDYDLD